jgi:hypothetical protein
MATVDVECSECGAELQVEEDRVGSSMTCPKCLLPCVVERPGGYDLVEEPRGRSGRSASGGERSASLRPEPVETEEQRVIRERLERWAGDS